jgi:trans-2,3-dihydro-3-hydroxyanthranilate isomerase
LGSHRLTWLDVFCDGPLRGNQLAVVHDADDLDEATMLAFTRETKLSESTFVQAASREGADYRNRIFDPRQELRFAGHPSLGTAVAVARAAGETDTTYVQETIAGLQPIDVRREGDRAEVSMLLEPASFGRELDPGEVLATAGLGPDHADPDLPVQVVSTGVPQVIAPVREEALAHARPDYSAIQPLLDDHEAVVLYLAAYDPAGGRAHARAFGHTADMGEDPATGSAAGPLMAYLHARAGIERLAIDQGLEMGRPSLLECSVEDDRVRVGGGAAIVIEGTVLL